MSAIERFHRLPLPDNLTPQGTWCVVVRVPADMQYVGQLIGLLDLLKFSQTFQRDDTLTGAALVSRTWETALESVPIEIIDCEDIGVSSQRWRVKPGEPFTSQFSHDGGLTWTDYLIQPHWPTLITPPTDTLPGAAANAGKIIRNFPEWMAGAMLSSIAGGDTKTQTIDSLMATLAPYTGNNAGQIRDAIGLAYDALAQLPTPTAEEYATDCMWLADQNYIMEFTQAIPGWLQDFTTLMVNLSQDIADEINRLFWEVGSAFNGSDLWQWIQNNPEGGGGAGFGGDCPTGASDTLTIDPNEWETWQYTTTIFPAGTVYVRVSGQYERANNVLPCELSGLFADSQFAQASLGQDPYTIPAAGSMQIQTPGLGFQEQLTYEATHIYLYELVLSVDTVIGYRWVPQIRNGCHEGTFTVELSTTPF